MADNNPITPGGAVPPKPGDAAKVQPKKETVRISLPPKPSSSPTIKLPTVPAGGPAAAPAAPASAATATPAPAASAPAAPRPPTASGGATLSTAASASRPPTSTGAPVTRPPGATTGAPAAQRPLPSAVRRVSGLDVGLGIAAAVIGLGAVASIALLLNLK